MRTEGFPPFPDPGFAAMAIRTAFQPIVELRSRTIYAYEALVRGPSGESAESVFGPSNPSGLAALDHLIRLTALRTAKRLGIAVKLSVNLFPQVDGCPSASIRQTLDVADREGFPVDQLIFEITESARVPRPGRLRDFIALHREIGFQTAIDDFGAGHSGLGLLSEFRPDIVKLDMAFARHAPAHARSRTIIRNIFRTASQLGCKVIAEGVETQEESDVLSDLGISCQQGYLFSMPQLEVLAAVQWPATHARERALPLDELRPSP